MADVTSFLNTPFIPALPFLLQPHLPTAKALENAPPFICVQISVDLHDAQEVLPISLSSTVYQKDATAWRQ